MTTHDDYLNQLEQGTPVYCVECRWFRGTVTKSCLHANAEYMEQTPEFPVLRRYTIEERNAHNDCPDYEAGQPWDVRQEADHIRRVAGYVAGGMVWYVLNLAMLSWDYVLEDAMGMGILAGLSTILVSRFLFRRRGTP